MTKRQKSQVLAWHAHLELKLVLAVNKGQGLFLGWLVYMDGYYGAQLLTIAPGAQFLHFLFHSLVELPTHL